jgi:predicted membrane-bound mannosyltransferase/DNA-binding beta-propeller fold protein YncE
MQAEPTPNPAVSSSPAHAWLDRPLFKDGSIKVYTLIVIAIFLITVLSRFLMLGERVMSHDEVNHVVPSWELYTGKGYAHNPVTHGPFQFHIVALTYFLLGDNDFSSRVPAALFSCAAVIFVLFAFPRYLGRAGAIFGALFFAISPYMLFYGRYTRNEGFIELFGVLLLYAVLRHMDTGDKRSLFLLTGALVFHYASKETAWIYSAQLLIFLAFLFIMEIQRAERGNTGRFVRFFSLLGGAILAILIAIIIGIANAKPPAADAAAAGTGTEAVASAAAGLGGLGIAVEAVLVAAAIVLGVLAFLMLLRDFGWPQLRKLRSLNLLILAGTLILPQLTAFPVKIVGWNPIDYSTPGLLRTGIFLILMFVISAVVGFLWNRRLWLQNAFLFYSVYVFLYTTMFTNGNGFFTGIVGGLGYWLSQQGVNRGSQPLYYYALVQMPVYEYLALLGSALAVYFALRYDRLAHIPGRDPAAPQAAEPALPLVEEGAAEEEAQEFPRRRDLDGFYTGEKRLPVLFFLIFWGITSLIAYSYAGERMPWLTVHITLGFLLAAGWGVGYLVDTTEWKKLITYPAVIAILLLPVFLTSVAGLAGRLMGANPPFSGNSLDQLQSTSSFLLAIVGSLASGAGILVLLRALSGAQILRLVTAGFFTIVTILTARTAFLASFVNYDTAKEFLVYAHAARGPKDVLAQIEEISRRTTMGNDLAVAYSGDGLYPYWWYLRNYPNKRWFGEQPTRELKDLPVIIAGEDAMNKMQPIVGDNFVKIQYMRLWWPMQGYYNLTWDRVRGALTDANMRQALWNIWLNRDYTLYAQITNDQTLTLENWQPSARMDVYIRKDVIGQIWNYGAAPSILSEVKPDPYEDKIVPINSETMLGMAGSEPGNFSAPRGLALAADGSVYVADSRNHRIQHFSADGALLNYWGTFADSAQGDAPGGTFNEPWDVAVGLDGSVYVTDTWNHRIQQFTADGEFIRTWGYFGQAEQPDGFWGPRALAIDSRGRVYVTDTGNKRVVVFEADGTYVTQFGSVGLDVGQFDEPVGLAIDAQDEVYVADTWNQRIQVFQPDAEGLNFTPVRQWEVSGWLGQSLDNKPFIEISPATGNLLVADPEGSRVLIFDPQGNFISGFGNFGAGMDAIGMASGIAVEPDGKIWISDGANNRLMRFVLP